MSKSSANPRKYSRGKDALDPEEPLLVFVEIRVNPDDITTLDSHLRYLLSRRPSAVATVMGIRREANKLIVTLGVDMGPIRAALKGQSPRMQNGYDLLWDIWEQMVDRSPVFASQPAASDMATARRLGFAVADVPTLECAEA
jgi:hypothetical protein